VPADEKAITQVANQQIISRIAPAALQPVRRRARLWG
jgi:hypothetical protein